MTALTKMRCIFPLRTGLSEVECWAPSATSEIVTHPFLGIIGGQPDPQGDRWVLSHRRSGKSVSTMSFPNVESALIVAGELDKIEAFKEIRVVRLQDGPVNDDAFMCALRDQVSARLAEFASRAAVEERDPSSTPQQEQPG